MRGLRSRILRTLQSLPNAAAEHSNALLPPPDAAAPAPSEAMPEPADGGRRGDDDGDKENFSPEANPRKAKKMKVTSDRELVSPAAMPLEEFGGCYRRPELESASLFDPDLLAAFRVVVDAYTQALEKTQRLPIDADADDDIAAALDAGGRDEDPLAGLECRCPPGGARAVVLYTTSLRGVRKTFEDCATVRRLLDGLRVAFLERDVSMHAPYRDELRALLPPPPGGDGAGAVPLPPRLFVDGRYVGGADEVVALHERSRLRPMLRRAARRRAGDAACAVCGGAWFVVCGGCSGRHWLYDDGSAAAVAASRVPCPGCNENGLVPCPLCS
ncbi:hypothetical protein ACQJBY_045603 [Aegilops geniculata]